LDLTAGFHSLGYDVCPSGKLRYRSRLGALLALSRLQGDAARDRRQREGRRAETRVYECNLCQGWHLSSHPEGRS